MKRRNFLSMIGAAGLAPLIPVPAAATPVAAGYNRYMYGLAVFHARTRSTVSIADLVARLRVTPGIAEALMSEMRANGVLAPVVNAAAGTMRAISPNGRSSGTLDRFARKAMDALVPADEPEVSEKDPAARSGETLGEALG